MAKQINNYKKAWRDRIECEFIFFKNSISQRVIKL